MLDPGVKARDTTGWDTPASAATSNDVTRDRMRGFWFLDRLLLTLTTTKTAYSRLNALGVVGEIVRRHNKRSVAAVQAGEAVNSDSGNEHDRMRIHQLF